MYIGERFRKDGLGETVRHIWAGEKINPPRMTDAQTWAWINRSDVAYGLVSELVWDPRLQLLGAAACVSPAASYASAHAVELVRATERACYGVDVDAWVQQVGLFSAEREKVLREKGKQFKPIRGPDPLHTHTIENPDWQDWVFSSVATLAGALGAMRQHAPWHYIQRELRDSTKYAWRGLREKFRTVDNWPDSAAIRCANELQLRLLRQVITPDSFTAPYTYKRSGPQ